MAQHNARFWAQLEIAAGCHDCREGCHRGISFCHPVKLQQWHQHSAWPWLLLVVTAALLAFKFSEHLRRCCSSIQAMLSQGQQTIKLGAQWTCCLCMPELGRFACAQLAAASVWKGELRTDTQYCSDINNGVQVSFWDQIQGIRNTELGVLWKSFLVAAVNSFLLNFLPTFVSVATFFGYVLLGHNLTAAEAFTSLALFNVCSLSQALSAAWVQLIVLDV